MEYIGCSTLFSFLVLVQKFGKEVDDVYSSLLFILTILMCLQILFSIVVFNILKVSKA
jgi:hypothetical protein